jgi:large subunit ribosomal protein L31
MAKSTEITYFSDATVTCSNCNSVYTLGLTVEKVSVEICGNCHPFYTGQETLIDTAGRIEKFEARALQAGKTEKKSKFKTRKTRQTLADLATEETVEEEKPTKKPKKTEKIAEAVEAVTPAEITTAEVAATEESVSSDETKE